MCLQEDVPTAHDTLRRIREMESNHGCHILLAHDSSWIVDGRDPTLLQLVNPKMLAEATSAIASGEVF